ncbi:ROK family protein, partial [Candidatus Saccharibacteria bacterium]|nr:ROK family protein [Candidatus Saccharibacteria bacterium]
MSTTLLGIDIGGTKIRLTKSTGPIKIGETITIPTPASWHEAKYSMKEAAQQLKGPTPQAIGVAAPGPLDRLHGRLNGLTNLPWHPPTHMRDDLMDLLNIPVVVEHDAICAGVSEARYGAGRRYRYFIYITISTGIGSALILDGLPLPGRHTQEGGRQIIDWQAHNPIAGSFEHHASGRAINRQFGKIAADIRSKRDWEIIADNIARGLYNIISICDPQAIILGGGVSNHLNRFQSLLLKRLGSLPLLYPIPPIKQAHHIETAPLLGALIYA